MIDIKYIRENPDLIKQIVTNKKSSANVDRLLELDGQVHHLQQKIEELRRIQNTFTKDDLEKARANKELLRQSEDSLVDPLKEFTQILRTIPNIPTQDTPIGLTEAENKVLRSVGVKPEFNFTPKPHWELGEDLDVIDSQAAAAVSGARFTYLKGDLALMQFALINYTLGVVTNQETLREIAQNAGLECSNKPFIPIIPPVFIKPEVMDNMARLEPKDERYYIPSDNLFLTGSAEHTLGSMHMNETIKEDSFPLRYIGYSTAFRREAGSYGKDTRGILRLHQFDKLEMESFSLPEDSLKEQDFNCRYPRIFS